MKLNLFKRQKTTVSNLLNQDDVTVVLAEADKDKANITDLMVIYQDKEGYINWHVTGETTLDRKILLLEQVKVWLLQGDKDD